jgi:hypothetical protein
MGDLVWGGDQKTRKALDDQNVGSVATSMRKREFGMDVWARRTVEKSIP